LSWVFWGRLYKGVIAERQIRLLKSQVSEQRNKGLTGRARRSLEEGALELMTFEEQDQDDDAGALAGLLSHRERRPCKVAQRASQHQTASVALVSTEKLLEASLHSLEKMGRKMHLSAGGAAGGGGSGLLGSSLNMSQYSGGGDFFLDEPEGDRSRSFLNQSSSSHGYRQPGHAAGGNDDQYPSESYLRGALWLGRNLTMVSEDLSDAVDAFRTKYLHEIAAASQDTDSRRSAHRLALLASSGVTEAHSLAAKSRLKTREILQVSHLLE
jgi:hypothetical protein